MPKVNVNVANELIWYQPQRFKREFELCRGQEVLGKLQFQPAPAVSWGFANRHQALAETSDGRWSFSVTRHGFLGLKANIKIEGTNSGVLDAGFLLLNGDLKLSQMPALRWVGGMARRSSDSFLDMMGSPVLRLDHGDFFERINARVSILSPTAALPFVALLASLGLYMRILMNKVNR
ncbi:MAG: hypothetical protein M3R67_10525 [Acidobacteriota bacterium]|nr:hypothetical protein [Acidobacteriota bacterium]